jgi:thiol:disulfide interchange protein DsbA
MKKLLLVFAAAAALAGCGQKSTPVETDAATTAGTPTDAAPPPASTAAPSAAELDQAATATQESEGTAPAVAGDPSLERLVAMPESTQLPGGRWKAGTHYRPIVPAQATNVSAGEVEVIEFLWLACGGCYALNGHVQAWKAKLPEYVKFRSEHVMWGPSHRELGRLLYTLEVMGRSDLVTAAFEEIHRHGRNLVAANAAATEQLQVAFAKAQGLNEADFKRESKGFAVTTRLKEAEVLGRRYPIDGTPAFVVNGKYFTTNEMAGGAAELMQLLSDLAAAEKR